MPEARGISAMVRARDEEEFLEPAIRSILDHVEEVVLVDNLSRDKTPSIVDALWKEFPEKVIPHRYPHEVRRVGREHWELSERDGSSPHLSSSFYNWCLDRCTQPYVLKWDGDMVALGVLGETLDKWRTSDEEVLVFHGANVHRNLRDLISARTDSREELLAPLSIAALPSWATSLTHDYPEPRLFPRAGARYGSGVWTQGLESPHFSGPGDPGVLRAGSPQYLHLKFAKRKPCANYTPDLAEAITSNVVRGPALGPEMRSALRRFGIGEGS